MNNSERKYLVSTAEDFFYQLGVTSSSTQTAMMSVKMTAERRGTDYTNSDIAQIISEARDNYARGKKTKPFLGIFY